MGSRMMRFGHHPQYKMVQEQVKMLLTGRPVYIVQLDFKQFSSPLKRQLLQIIILSAVTLLVGAGGVLSYSTLKGLKGSKIRLGKLERELQRSERLAALGKMAAGVAHELRNPLSSIKGLALLLKSHFPETGTDADSADILVGEVERLNRSIGELLDYARPGKLNNEVFTVEELVEKTMSLVRLDAESYNIEIKMKRGRQANEICGDRDKLSQVLLNIFLNAIQAMPDGGSLTVSLEKIGKMVEIIIRDNGCGIEHDDLPRIFDPYYTTKNDGTGLGLAMSLKIVEEHGGHLTIVSSPGSYTEVCLELPV